MTPNRMRHPAGTVLASVLLLILMPSVGPAQDLALDAAACAGAGSTSLGETWVESGFRLSSAGGLSSWCSGSGNHTGTTGLFIEGAGQLATLTAVDGTPFSLTSIALASAFAGGAGATIWFSGLRRDGSLLATAFSFPTSVMSPRFTPFAFDHTWYGLVAVSWWQGGSPGAGAHQFGAIGAEHDSFGTRMLEFVGDEGPLPPGATVPEPATMALLATGLVGMSLARRRRIR